MPSGIIREKQVQEILGPYEADLWEAYRRAWASWLKVSVDLSRPSANTRGAWVNNKAVEEIESLLPPKHFRLIPAAGRHVFRVSVSGHPSVLLHIKKLRHGLPSNYPTKTAKKWNQQVDLPGVPEIPRVTLGYETDPAQVELRDVRALFMTNARRASWSYSLDPERRAKVLSLPLSPAPDAPLRLSPKEGLVIPIRPADSSDDD